MEWRVDNLETRVVSIEEIIGQVCQRVEALSSSSQSRPHVIENTEPFDTSADINADHDSNSKNTQNAIAERVEVLERYVHELLRFAERTEAAASNENAVKEQSTSQERRSQEGNTKDGDGSGAARSSSMAMNKADERGEHGGEKEEAQRVRTSIAALREELLAACNAEVQQQLRGVEEALQTRMRQHVEVQVADAVGTATCTAVDSALAAVQAAAAVKEEEGRKKKASMRGEVSSGTHDADVDVERRAISYQFQQNLSEVQGKLDMWIAKTKAIEHIQDEHQSVLTSVGRQITAAAEKMASVEKKVADGAAAAREASSSEKTIGDNSTVTKVHALALSLAETMRGMQADIARQQTQLDALTYHQQEALNALRTEQRELLRDSMKLHQAALTRISEHCQHAHELSSASGQHLLRLQDQQERQRCKRPPDAATASAHLSNSGQGGSVSASEMAIHQTKQQEQQYVKLKDVLHNVRDDVVNIARRVTVLESEMASFMSSVHSDVRQLREALATVRMHGETVKKVDSPEGRQQRLDDSIVKDIEERVLARLQQQQQQKKKQENENEIAKGPVPAAAASASQRAPSYNKDDLKECVRALVQEQLDLRLADFTEQQRSQVRDLRDEQDMLRETLRSIVLSPSSATLQTLDDRVRILREELHDVYMWIMEKEPMPLAALPPAPLIGKGKYHTSMHSSNNSYQGGRGEGGGGVSKTEQLLQQESTSTAATTSRLSQGAPTRTPPSSSMLRQSFPSASMETAGPQPSSYQQPLFPVKNSTGSGATNKSKKKTAAAPAGVNSSSILSIRRDYET